MTTGPQDPAKAARDRLRAGHADREQVIETLKTAFVDGRLTKPELDARAGQAHGLGNPYHPWSSLCAGAAMVATIAAVMVFAHGVGESVEQRRSRRQPPPRPGPGGHALETERRAGIGHDPAPDRTRTDQTRTDVRAHRPRRPVPAGADRVPRSLRPAPEGA